MDIAGVKVEYSFTSRKSNKVVDKSAKIQLRMNYQSMNFSTCCKWFLVLKLVKEAEVREDKLTKENEALRAELANQLKEAEVLSKENEALRAQVAKKENQLKEAGELLKDKFVETGKVLDRIKFNLSSN